jgi:hypothetical protein
VRLVRIVNGERENINLNYHVCTDEDYESFYPPSKDSLTEFSRLKENRVLFCLDDFDKQPVEVEIFGENDTQDHQRFEFNLLPCSKEYPGPSDSPVDRDQLVCNDDKEAMFDYMQSSDLKVLFNSSRYDS